MISQIYLSGRVVAQPELGQTKKGKPMVRLLLETELVRETSPGQFQSEIVVLPVSFFSREAQSVSSLRKGNPLTVGAHLYGTKFESDNGTKYGCQIVTDQVFEPLRQEVHP
jgi:single-stranded DNA-binding protein